MKTNNILMLHLALWCEFRNAQTYSFNYLNAHDEENWYFMQYAGKKLLSSVVCKTSHGVIFQEV